MCVALNYGVFVFDKILFLYYLCFAFWKIKNRNTTDFNLFYYDNLYIEINVKCPALLKIKTNYMLV